MNGGFDCLVVGGGVVGLACGAALANRGRSVAVVEREGDVGTGVSSRNSQVLHAGLYYPTGSLKAESCVEGREATRARCRRLGLPERRVGKVVVATTEEETAHLETLAERARANGAGAVEIWTGTRVTEVEPRVRAVAGLWSPETGIVDAHALVSSYRAELEAAGGVVVLRTEVRGMALRGGHWEVETLDGSGENFTVECGAVVNAAGLSADRVAASSGVDVESAGWRLHLCKGDYFGVVGGLGPLSTHLVYPVPSGGGLGAHVTMDLGGRYRFGPDAEYVAQPNYAVDAGKAAAFAAAIQRYMPDIRAEHLVPEMAGIRPKLSGPGEGFRDFVLEESSARGVPGVVHLVGIESPGLTAAPALARRVAELL